MSEEKKKRNKIIGISIGILVVLLVVISSTYAYWQITKSQDGSNDIIAACLDINMESVDGTFALDPAWPISDSEGMQLEGYTFTVTNNCEEDVNYVIGMDSLEVSGVDYLDYNNIKISIDNNESIIYGEQEDIDHIEADDTYTIRDSKKIATSVVKSGQPNIHNVKVWIKSDAPVEEQSKVFSGRMFITGGQKIVNDKPIVQATPETCFEINGGEIIGYDESCGESVIIPASVNGTPVTTIDTNAFKKDFYNYPIVVVTDSLGAPLIAYITQPEKEKEITTWAQNNNFGNVEIELYIDMPTLEDGQMVLFCDITKELNNACVQSSDAELSSKFVTIKSLDLSQAYNLEKIEPRAFSNFDAGLVDSRDIIAEIEKNEVSLTSLIFGKPNDKLIIGYGAFNGINVDNLTMYSNIIAMGHSETVNYENEYTYGFFTGSQIDNLTVEYVKEYENIGYYDEFGVWEQLFPGIISQNVIIGEGITTLNQSAFNSISDTSEINNISLPSTITYLGRYSLNNVQNITFAAGHCNNVQIDKFAWTDDSVITPSTCILGQNME